MPSRGFLFSVEKCYNGDLTWPLPLGHEGSPSSEAFAVRLEPDRTAFFARCHAGSVSAALLTKS